MMTVDFKNKVQSSTPVSIDHLLPGALSQLLADFQPASTPTPNQTAASVVFHPVLLLDPPLHVSLISCPTLRSFQNLFRRMRTRSTITRKCVKVLHFPNMECISRIKLSFSLIKTIELGVKTGWISLKMSFGVETAPNYYLIRDCDKLGPAKLPHYISAILPAESELISDPDHILDCLQNCDDAARETLKFSVKQKFV